MAINTATIAPPILINHRTLCSIYYEVGLTATTDNSKEAIVVGDKATAGAFSGSF
jgi:hypothetical protein